MSEQLRIGDAERNQAASDLGEHFAQGRLSAEEHAERLDQVMRARTRADLAPAFSDLPGGEYGVHPTPYSPPGASGRERQWRPPGRRRGLPLPLFVLLFVLVAVTVVTNWPIVLIGVGIWFFAFRGRAWHGPRNC
jgi:hypothetical protein